MVGHILRQDQNSDYKLCSIDLETKWKETKRKTKNYDDEDRGKKVKGEGGWGSWDEM